MRFPSFVLAALIPLTVVAAERGPIEREHEPLGARHYILQPQHVLSDAERAELAAEGVRIQRAMPGGRYMIRVAPDSAFDDSDIHVRSLSALSVADKLQRSAYRSASRGLAFARLKVLFHDDVSMDDALAAVDAAGGTPEKLLPVAFGPLRSMTVQIPSANLQQFAADERVMMIYGGLPHRAVAYNTEAAILSKVDQVQGAPYNLTGKDVTISYFELSPGDVNHPEFEGRYVTHVVCRSSGDSSCTSTSNFQHATHVAGTMVAKGISANAKGMAPEARVHEYRGADPDDQWLIDKDTTLKALGSVGDNNSWGFTAGWAQEGGTSWTWTEDEELIGGYEGTISAVLDHIALNNQTLMLHAAGNEGDNVGPSASPFKHNHVDSRGNPTTDVWCYTQNGSGTDCPNITGFGLKLCSDNVAFCEKVHHPISAPFGSINWLASTKNILSVGAVDFQPAIASFSSRGPTRDGRVKPELCARGVNVFSTFPDNTYATISGTSMATPVVTGTMALFTQQWRITTGNATARPNPVMLKTLAIAGADDVGNPGPDVTYGYGLLNAKKSIDLIIADGGVGKRIRSDSATQGAQFDYPMTLSSAQDLRVVLSWFDPEALPLGTEDFATAVLINDLDLKVIAPDGSTAQPYVLVKNDPCYTNAASTCQNAQKGVNTLDNNEEVEIKNAAAGTYHVIVSGTRITANPPQAFVVVGSGDFGAVLPPCVDSTEPNDTAAAAYGPLTLSTPVGARLCSDSDTDFFKFTSNATGTASVTVTTTDTAVTVTLSAPGVTTATKTIAANSTDTVSTTINTAAATQFTAQVSLSGTRGANASYTIKASFPFSAKPRRRGTTHSEDDPKEHDGVEDPAHRRN